MTNDNKRTAFGDVPSTREEAYAEGILEAAPSPAEEFLPLGVRRVLYLLAIAAAAVAPVLAVSMPEYGAALTTGAGVLSVAALGTALANTRRA